jgi:hypothetical protein
MHPTKTFDNDLDHSEADKPKFLRGMFLWLQQVAADLTLPPEAARLAIVLARVRQPAERRRMAVPRDPGELA